MPIFTAALGSVSGLAFLSNLFSSSDTTFQSYHHSSSLSSLSNPSFNFLNSCRNSPIRRHPFHTSKVSVSGDAKTEGSSAAAGVIEDLSESSENIKQARRSADWKVAKAYNESGYIHEGRIEGFNGGGLLVRFYSLVGFLPYPQLSPSHSCKEPQKSIQEIAKALTGSLISLKGRKVKTWSKTEVQLWDFIPRSYLFVFNDHFKQKGPNRSWEIVLLSFIGQINARRGEHATLLYSWVIQADQENRKLIFSEKEAMWSKFSQQINVGDIFEARVGSVEDYGCYHLTGLVHISEVSWDLVQDVRDILSEGEDVRVKIIKIDREVANTFAHSTEEEATSSCPISHREGFGYLSNDKKAANVITYSAVEHFYIEHVEGKVENYIVNQTIGRRSTARNFGQSNSSGDGSVVTGSSSTSSPYNIEPLPGLQTILEELLREEGISEIRISRQGFEKRVVSQDLQLWLSNAPAIGKQFTLLARAGRQQHHLIRKELKGHCSEYWNVSHEAHEFKSSILQRTPSIHRPKSNVRHKSRRTKLKNVSATGFMFSGCAATVHTEVSLSRNLADIFCILYK
ncbi:unnamed protein product [Camellia sinensis]